MSCKLKLQKPFKKFLRTLSIAILYVCIMVSVIHGFLYYPEFTVVMVLGLIVIFLSFMIILAIVDKLVQYKEIKKSKSMLGIFKIWFSKNVISCEKQNVK